MSRWKSMSWIGTCTFDQERDVQTGKQTIPENISVRHILHDPLLFCATLRRRLCIIYRIYYHLDNL